MGEEYTTKKFLISLTVFNKFQADCSSGSVKFMPLATMLQRKQNHPPGLTVSIVLSSIFLLCYPHLNKKKESFTYTSGRNYIWPSHHTEILRIQKSQQRGQREPERKERESKNTTHYLRINPIGNRTSEALSQLPYVLTKIPTAAVSPGSCFIISPSPSSGANSFSPMLDFH